MILYLENNKQIRGDLVRKAVFRSDLSPIPATLEATITAGEDNFDKFLKEGRKIILDSGEEFLIVKSAYAEDRKAPKGNRKNSVFQVIGLLSSCAEIANVRKTALIKESTSLLQVYRAAGAKLRAVENDVNIDRFYCFVGDTPSYQISKVLQEAGGVVRWKNNRLNFIRLRDLFKQKPIMTLPENASNNIETKFTEDHEVPWFYSVNDSGSFVFGDRSQARSSRFTPFKNVQQLYNMSHCLIRRKVMNILMNRKISAGDLIRFSDNVDLVVITVAHCICNGADTDETMKTYSRLWLGALN